MVNSSHKDIAGHVQADFICVFFFLMVYFTKLQYPGVYLEIIGIFMNSKGKIFI
jgi:hypothetical protein